MKKQKTLRETATSEKLHETREELDDQGLQAWRRKKTVRNITETLRKVYEEELETEVIRTTPLHTTVEKRLSVLPSTQTRWGNLHNAIESESVNAVRGPPDRTASSFADCTLKRSRDFSCYYEEDFVYCAANGFDYCFVTSPSHHAKMEQIPADVCAQQLSTLRVLFYMQSVEFSRSCKDKSVFEF